MTLESANLFIERLKTDKEFAKENHGVQRQ